MTDPEVHVDENKLIAQRRQKLNELRRQGNPYPTDFRRNALAAELQATHGDQDGAVLEHHLVGA